MQQKKGTKKIVFSTEIDSALTGYAIGVSFLGIGLFLLLKPAYFFAPIASYIVGAIIGTLGVLGIGIELSRSSKIKGFDNLAMGIVFFAVWLVAYILADALWANILFFVFLIIGCYAISLGLIQGIYSIISNHKEQTKDNNKNGIGALLSQSVLLLTQLCGLIIAILNIFKAVNI